MAGKVRIFWGCLLVCMSCFGAEEKAHMFTDQQDRTVFARIIRMDERRGLVELELENKRRIKVKPSIFCEKDQVYIKSWIWINTFTSNSGLVFTGKKKTVGSGTKNGGRGVVQELEEVAYNCELKNKSALPYENIKVEYCVFWAQETIDEEGGEVCLKQSYSGRHEIERIGPLAALKFQTDPVTLVQQRLKADYYYESGTPDRQSAKIKGVWVKVFMTTPDGKTTIRDFCEPGDVIKRQKWTAPDDVSKKKKKK